MPSTWVSYSKEIYGETKKQTVATAEYVTQQKVYKWLKDGMTERQIFLIWNQGHTGKCSAGTNKYGAKYDSCKYADDALKLLTAVTADNSLYLGISE